MQRDQLQSQLELKMVKAHNAHVYFTKIDDEEILEFWVGDEVMIDVKRWQRCYFCFCIVPSEFAKYEIHF